MVRLPHLDPETGVEMDLVAMLERQAEARPDHVFVRTPVAAVTYADLRDRSARLAGAFTALDIGAETSVAVVMDNSVEQVVVWFALARIGALHVPVNTALVGPRLRHVLEVAGCSVVVLDAGHETRLDELDPLPARLRALVVHEPADQPPPSLTRRRLPRHRLADLTASGQPVPPAPADPLGPATLLFTSGTTGVSKACTLSRRYLAAQAAAHADNLGLGPDDVLFCPFPLFHIDAATLTVGAALSVGATAALTPAFSASRFWDDVRSAGATVFNFMGATLAMLWKQPDRETDRDHRVRLAWGVPMPEWHDAWEERFGFPLLEVYGSTDAGVPVYDPVDEPHRRGSCGRVTDLYELRIDGDERVGEILVRGRHPGLTMSGYYGMPEATAQAIDADGWVRTGDLGSLDADGRLTFIGRVSDSIRRRGENISAFEVEELVATHPAVLEVAAVGVPSELTEEDVKVWVVARPGAELTPQELHAFLTGRAPRFMVPRYYELTEALPKTPTQKVEKARLKEQGVSDSTWDAESVAGR